MKLEFSPAKSLCIIGIKELRALTPLMCVINDVNLQKYYL